MLTIPTDLTTATRGCRMSYLSIKQTQVLRRYAINLLKDCNGYIRMSNSPTAMMSPI